MALLTPYVIDGAKHSARLFRRQLQYSAGTGSGIARAADFLVTPTPTPGRGVRIAQGGVLIQSRDAGATRETYGVENDRALDFYGPEGSEGIPGTGSAARRDLIIVEVMDHKMTSVTYPTPADKEVGPWSRIRVVPGVAADVERVEQVPSLANVTAYAIAAIDWPANWEFITRDMITDLREVLNPQRDEIVFARPRISADSTTQRFLTAAYADGGEYFPGGGGIPNSFRVRIPEWATRMVIDARWMSIEYGKDRRPTGRYWIEFGNEYRERTWPNKRQWEFQTQEFFFNAPRNDVGSSAEWSLMDEVPVPAKLRGKFVTFAFKAGVTNVPGSNHTWMGALGGLGCRITFAEKAIGSDML